MRRDGGAGAGRGGAGGATSVGVTSALPAQPGLGVVGTPPRPRRASVRQVERKSERTRRRVMIAAKHLFDRRAYRDTTIDDITPRAGAPHGALYLYFHDHSR